MRPPGKPLLYTNLRGKEEISPMGNKIMRRLVAVTLAMALVLTSGIGVFAAGSSQKGTVNSLDTTIAQSGKKITIKWTGSNAETYTLKVGSTTYTVKGTSKTVTVKANKTYKITVKAANGDTVKTHYRWTKKSSSVKSAAKGSKKVKVSWKKVSGATGYQIWEKVNGTWKLRSTVGKSTTSKTLKSLNKKGAKAVFAVRPIKKSGSTKWLGIRHNAKAVKVK